MQRNNKKRSQLNQEERIEIYALRKQGVSMRGIGRILKRPHSTISKEFSRNRDYRGWDKYRYDPLKAEKKTKQRRVEANQKHTKLLKNPKMLKSFEKRFIVEADSQGIDEIIGRMRKEWIEIVSTSTMYNFIRRYKPSWERMLRHKSFGYKKKWQHKKTALVGVPLIEERSEEINNREVFGNWEVDMVVWPKWEKWGLLTLVERKTRYVIIKKLKRATKREVMYGIIGALKRYEVMSITSDNGREFAGLWIIGKYLKCLVYRCHPYSSWEKWSNERMNGLIRWFIAKGWSIESCSEAYIKEIADKLNRKPRKKLGYQTAEELFGSQVQKKG